MDANALFEAIQAAAVVVGVGFAVYEMRKYRWERNREAAMELLHAFQTPDFAKALVLVYRLPDGLSKKEIESRLGEDLHPVYAMTTTWESIGVLVFRGEVGIELVDDFFSGPIVVSWRKLQRYFFEERSETGRETVGEWFQWLAERFAEREGAMPPVPAHVQHRDWRPR
ncbi:MAG: hypothetical protein OEW35_19365 [Gammaproteobacteria bacterium]|nr:hypothetical protein [Gammaproteobacteria bacterium]MDH4312800.1 hypothetical protein [Gammaproteobacteria bacterium]